MSGTCDGNKINMPHSFISNKTYRTMVPLRFVSENMDMM